MIIKILKVIIEYNLTYTVLIDDFGDQSNFSNLENKKAVVSPTAFLFVILTYL